ncbi:MAG: ABC transporter permease [Bdellovibrionaceae bacterium]|nr:ABC transporter permease [Pseudobdellovibrionaceae bacterium]NUM60017.1 ABC transporter permease [Pseudobdellovibrionaceae bacterium]
MKKINYFFFIICFIVYPLINLSRWNQVDIHLISMTPSFSYWSGTDSLGRDYFLRCIQGGFISLILGICSVTLAHVIGFLVGSLSQFRSFYLKFWLPRFSDILDIIPNYLLVSLLAIFWNLLFKNIDPVLRTLISTTFSIGLVNWMSISRLVRAEITNLRQKEFISVTSSMGASHWHLVKTHYFGYLSQILTISMVQHLPQFILTESFLSYIGIGLTPPYLSLGSLIAEGWRLVTTSPLLFFTPSLLLVYLSLNLRWILTKSKTVKISI